MTACSGKKDTVKNNKGINAMDYLLSVVIPCYNCEKTLKKAVDSVICQPCAERIEIILVDDGSKDNTPQLCDDIGQNNKNVKVLHCRNGGAGAARNIGIDIATGKYIAMLDSDDWWSSNVFNSDFMSELRDNSIDIYGFSLQFVSPTNKRGKIIKSNPTEDAPIGYGSNKSSDAYHCCYLYLRELVDHHHIRYPSIKTMEDPAFSAAALIAAKSYKAKDIVLYNYYINLDSFHHAIDDSEVFKSGLACNQALSDWGMREGLDISIDPRETLSGIVKYLPRYCATHSYQQTLEWIDDPLFEVLNAPDILPWKKYQKSYALWKKDKKLFWVKSKVRYYIPCKLKESRNKKPFIKLKNYIWYRIIKKIY